MEEAKNEVDDIPKQATDAQVIERVVPLAEGNTTREYMYTCWDNVLLESM